MIYGFSQLKTTQQNPSRWFDAQQSGEEQTSGSYPHSRSQPIPQVFVQPLNRSVNAADDAATTTMMRIIDATTILRTKYTIYKTSPIKKAIVADPCTLHGGSGGAERGCHAMRRGPRMVFSLFSASSSCKPCREQPCGTRPHKLFCTHFVRALITNGCRYRRRSLIDSMNARAGGPLYYTS